MSRVLIDANVLYPTVLREIVLGVAATGFFTPLWSGRILEEWARAAQRRGDGDLARVEIARVRDAWPDAEIEVSVETEARLRLPDPADTHVLAAAIDGGADSLLTQNLRDFPPRALSREGIFLRAPDPFLLEALKANPDAVRAVIGAVHATAERLSPDPLPLRTLLKRARLPRLGKALAG
ncbi:RSP_2648 family PIN domain-containing protein [Ovoidimarina sediminis]|uniref:RSP_2648 family PIN domain-containing protein n=1 Tax=Ovoidimarina sediminis TaxID=3079856 RepID=UPI00290B082F|nr:PIN domain-containing protein [Rhodophyticola sp. MJ-SS7]MDU8945359.1 PIN domain-containing protein [Rhodophyticola sp. MJ-SS7]